MNRLPVHHILHDILNFHKVSARLVPKQLSPELEKRRVDAYKELLFRHEAEGDVFLSGIWGNFEGLLESLL